MPEEEMQLAMTASTHCDFFFSIGTSTVVYPADHPAIGGIAPRSDRGGNRSATHTIHAASAFCSGWGGWGCVARIGEGYQRLAPAFENGLSRRSFSEGGNPVVGVAPTFAALQAAA